MEKASFDLLPTSTLGQYKIRARIGSGGMGDVYDAVHTALDKRVAIKTLRKRYLEDEVVVTRFLREGQLASKLRHPNIVDVTDVGMIDGVPCLVMEHLEGDTLSSLIKRSGALPVSELVDLLLPIIAAVDFAHDHRVLHRDLKPSNIFLARSWNGDIVPKVLDFGISKLVEESPEAALTTDSAFVGTPHYASPEAMRADRTQDGRADEYAMGVMLYEGATGSKPFADKGGGFVALAMAICAGTYVPPRQLRPDLPEAFEQVIMRAMALQPHDRYPKMRLLGEALLPYASERARMIWAPTFRSADGQAFSSPETQVLLRPSANLPSAPGTSSAGPGMSGPPSVSGAQSIQNAQHAMPPGWPTSAVRALSSYPAPNPGASHAGSLSQGGASSSGTLGAMSGPGPYAGYGHDPPSFGGGVGGSIHAGPMAGAPKQGGSTAILAAGVIVALLGVGVAGLAITRAGGKDHEPRPAVSGEATAAGTFAIDVHVVPETAAIELDGVAVGAGHVGRTFARDGKKHNLRVSAPGFDSVFLPFDEHSPPPEKLALRPLASPASASASASSTKPVSTQAGQAGQAGAGTGTGKGGTKGSKDSGKGSKTDNINPWDEP